jgi:hypothetical protein
MDGFRVAGVPNAFFTIARLFSKVLILFMAEKK